MCFQRYKAYPDGAEKAQSGENPVKSVRPHLRTTPFARRRYKLATSYLRARENVLRIYKPGQKMPEITQEIN